MIQDDCIDCLIVSKVSNLTIDTAFWGLLIFPNYIDDDVWWSLPLLITYAYTYISRLRWANWVYFAAFFLAQIVADAQW